MSDTLNPREARSVLWDLRKFLEDRGSLTPWETGMLLAVAEELLQQLLHYKESISWHTDCLNCGKLMTENYEQYVKLDKIQNILEGTDEDRRSTNVSTPT